MSEHIPNRNTLVMPISPDRSHVLPSTPTQRDIAALIADSVRNTLQRERGCAYRPLLDGSLVARFAEAAIFESLASVCRETSQLDILDLSFDDGAAWVRFFAFLRSRGLCPSINMIAVRDTTPDVREATARMRAAAAAAGLEFDSMFMVTAASDWPGAIVRRYEALAVVANMALHHVPDDGPHVDSLRTMVLRRVRRLDPKLVVVCEADFGPGAFGRLSRLGTHAHGSSANVVMDALTEMHEPGGGFKPASQQAPVTERATEPSDHPPSSLRPELPDRLENWRRRFFEAGYAAFDLMPLRGLIVRSSDVVSQAVIAPDQHALRLSWRGRPIAHATAWTPRSGVAPKPGV